MKRNRWGISHLFYWIGIAILFASCTPVTKTPAIIPLASAMPTISKTETVISIPTSKPTLTPTKKVEDYPAFLNAVQTGDDVAVKEFIADGYNVNWLDPYGLSLLNYAANQGNVKSIRLLIEAGAEVNYQDPWGMTSLHAALKEGHDDAALYLMKQGADVNLKAIRGTYVGFTSLHTAVYFGKVQLSTVEAVLTHGADTAVRDSKGKTALDYARDNGWKEAEDLLLKYEK